MKGFLFSADAILALALVILAIGLLIPSAQRAPLDYHARLASDSALMHAYRAEAPDPNEKTNCNTFNRACTCQAYSYRIGTTFFANQVCVGK